MLRETRKTAIGLGLAAAMATSCVYAADGQPLPTPKVNEITQKVWANPDLTEPTKGIRTLQDAQDFLDLGASRLGTSAVVKLIKQQEVEGY